MTDNYRIHIVKKARADIGPCVACGNQIKAGDTYAHTHAKKGRVSFCGNCKVDNALIEQKKARIKAIKTPKTESEIQEKVNAVIQEASSIEPEHAEPVESNQEPEATQDDNEVHVTVANCDKSVYCTKCKYSHVVGSRRYRQHKLYLGKKSV